MSGIMGLYDPVQKPRLNMVNPNEPLITKQLNETLWKRRIDKMVKAAKDTLTSQWAAPILLAILLGFVVYDRTSTNTAFNKQLSDQHDLLIRLETLHEVEEKDRAQERIDKKLDKDVQDVYRQKMQEQMKTLELIVTGKYPNNIGRQ